MSDNGVTFDCGRASATEAKRYPVSPTADVRRYESGAVRSTDADNVRFDLIPQVGLRRVAATCAEGAKKYGDNNWQKGMPICDLINHALRHIHLHLEGVDTSEDHLAHAAWNLMAAMHFEERQT